MDSYKWVISRVTIVITNIRGLITPLINTHEPQYGTHPPPPPPAPVAAMQSHGVSDRGPRASRGLV